MSGNLPFGFGMPDPGQGPGGGAFDMASLGAALQQLGQFLQRSEAQGATGPVNWAMVGEVARQAIAAQDAAGAGFAGSVTSQDRAWVADTCRLAEHWLDQATTFPAGPGQPQAWSRTDWLDATVPMWQRYVEPVAERMQQVVASAVPSQREDVSAQDLTAALPEQMRAMFPDGIPPAMLAMLKPMLGMMQQLSVASFSVQLGQALAGLAAEVVSAADIGIPLQSDPVVALVPANIAAFGAGIGIADTDVRLYLALRESAHQRLFAHVPWLRARLIGSIEEYARGISVDPGRLAEAMTGIDLSNADALAEVMASGLMQPEDTPEQRAALARLETVLALVEGWVEDVVATAIADRLPSAGALRETIRRRRAAGGPAERTFATLIGLELRPKAIREAATLFAVVRDRGGVDARDALWGHPDLLPTATDLEDPLGYAERMDAGFGDLGFDPNGQ